MMDGYSVDKSRNIEHSTVIEREREREREGGRGRERERERERERPLSIGLSYSNYITATFW